MTKDNAMKQILFSEIQIEGGANYKQEYVRRQEDYKAPFCFFWAVGNSHIFSKSELYLGDFDGNVWILPYDMKEKNEKPVQVFFNKN